MKFFLIIVFWSIRWSMFCQVKDYEFGYQFQDQHYYTFVDDNVPFIDLTKDKYFQQRRENKIKQIITTYIGPWSLDSLYLKDTVTFQKIIKSRFYGHGFSYVEISQYNIDGFKISYNCYPKSKYLSRRDSIMLRQPYYSSYVKTTDSLFVFHNYKDTIVSKTVFTKKIVYSLYKEQIHKWFFDSTSRGYKSEPIGYKFTPIKYFYLNDDRISKIKLESQQYNNYYEMSFKFPDSTYSIVNCSLKTSPFDSTKYLENKILKNKYGQVLKSFFYYTCNPKEYSCYLFNYNKKHHLIKVSYRLTAEFRGYAENRNKFIQFYKNGKLIKSIAHTNYNPKKYDIIYFYNRSGLVSEIHNEGYRICYEYALNNQ